MWRIAERRFVQHDGHVCLRNPFSPWEPQHAPSALHDGCIMLAKDRGGGPWEGRYAPPILHYVCIIHIPSLQLQKKPVSCREAEGLVTELSCPRFVTYSHCALSCAMRLPQTNEQLSRYSFFATVGWKCGGQPFSCRCSLNVTHCRKEICSPSLLHESIPAINFWDSKHLLPTEPQHFLPALHSGCIMPIPSLQLQKKAPVSCREAKRLVTQLWSPRF